MEKQRQNINHNSTSSGSDEYLLSEETVSALVNLGDIVRRIHLRLRREGVEIDIKRAIEDHENGDCQN